MPREDAIRLRHMLDAANEAIIFAQGKTRTDLDNNRMLVLALVQDIEIIGEAAYQISPETRDQVKEIPWEDIIGMRHRLVHAYFDINLDILWQTISDDLPGLISAMEVLQLEDQFYIHLIIYLSPVNTAVIERLAATARLHRDN